MGNALLRARIQTVRVEYNGDKSDRSLREELKKLDSEIAEAKTTIHPLAQQVASGATNKKGPLSKAKKKLADLEENKKSKQPDKDNTIVATLHYPRSGSSTVMATVPVDLASGETLASPATASFLDSGLLKEVIHGETTLKVNITDRDKRNPIGVFLRKVLGAIFGAVTKGPIGRISEVVVSSSASEVASSIGSAITGSDKDRVEVVAKSAEVQIRIDNNGAIQVLNSGTDGISYVTGILTLDLVTPKEFNLGTKVQVDQGEVVKAPVTIPKGAPNGQIALALSAEPVP